MADAEKEIQVQVINTTRNINTRPLRQAAGVAARKQQLIGGGNLRVPIGRPLVVSVDKLLPYMTEIQEKVRLGYLEVRTMDGRPYDLSSRAPTGDTPTAVTPPLPHPPLDSANNDTPWGERTPGFHGGEALSDLAVPGTISPDAGIPGVLSTNEKPVAPVADMPIIPQPGVTLEEQAEGGMVQGDSAEEDVPFTDAAATKKKGKNR